MIHNNIDINSDGHLTFAGVDTVALAAQYGTPLYLMDEDRIRTNCRKYVDTMKSSFNGNGSPVYASKALCTTDVLRIVSSEGMFIDTVSCGEIYTALRAGVSPDRLFFHGNNKTDEDIEYAIKSGVGCFVADNPDELIAINRIAGNAGKIQKVILRLTPGIDPHTFAAVATGKVDSKFGMAIDTSQADEFVVKALSLENISLEGYHCHVGSQCFDSKVFFDAADIMVKFIYEEYMVRGYMAKILDLGGGYGVRYVENDPQIDITDNIRKVAMHIKKACSEYDIPVPYVMLEPGRSIVADAGMTLYTVGGIKNIYGYKSYISIDGGMTDNPRYALYKSAYTVYNASDAAAQADMVATIAGHCCESGCIIQENVNIKTPERGDILAVCVTGAYNYSMSSNYNRFPRPAMVMLKDGQSRLSVRRETLDDLLKCDM